MTMCSPRKLIRYLIGLTATLTLTIAWSQRYTKSDREVAQQMLRDAAADVRKYYYDPKYHGLEWDAKVREAKEKIDKADSMDSAVSEVAALLDILNDSHTSFILPPRAYVNKYGFKLKMVGDRCFVVRLRPGSDAEQKGVMVGTEVLAINEHPVSRKTFWRLQYIYNKLRPQPGLRLTLAGDAKHERQLDVMAKIEPSPVIQYALHQAANQRARDWDEWDRLVAPQYSDKGDGLLAIRLPAFALSAEEVDKVLGKMKKHKGVVLDLRGNPGGFVDTVDRLLGGMFENDVKIYDRIKRDSRKPVLANGRHHDAFTGRLVVLVDSESASASELFARVVQLERRAFILGDRTSGMVMESELHRHEMFLGSDVYYATSVTEADLIMSDGKSLEHVGVDPDVVILPTAEDLAAKRDPAMAKAAGLVGVHISAEEAGGMFPDKESKERD